MFNGAQIKVKQIANLSTDIADKLSKSVGGIVVGPTIFTGNLTVQGSFIDFFGSAGAPGFLLSSTASGVEWIDPINLSTIAKAMAITSLRI